MARYFGYKRPKNTKQVLRHMLAYLGHHKISLAFVVLMVMISALASILGTYLLKPVINTYILPGDIPGLIRMMVFMGLLYLCGALSCFGYNRLMVHITQQVTSELRSDLFAHAQNLPLNYFERIPHGELMSRGANEAATHITEALNSSFTLMIQSFITVVGTITMLILLDWRLSSIVIVLWGLCFCLSSSTGNAANAILMNSRNVSAISAALWRRWSPGRRWKRSLTMKQSTLRNSAGATKPCGFPLPRLCPTRR